MTGCVRLCRAFFVLSMLAWAMPVAAQQTGSLSGRVIDTGGLALPGVTVEARGDVLPAPRVTTTGPAGEYRLPALPPGNYTLTFTLSGMQTVTRQAQVQLNIDTPVNATLGIAGLEETIVVTATAGLVDRDSAALSSAVSSDQIAALPTGQEYRDLFKLIPAVQFTQDSTRGPSAGGSGQDNVYQFDGVNVTMPLFGVLTAEPSTHDVAQVTTVRGGARAIDFDRSGGFTMDTVSKSGTSRYMGELSYQIQNHNMVAEQVRETASRFDQDRSWLTMNLGGPLLQDRLFFYGSFYRPEVRRGDQSNLYGPLPDFRLTRNEGFGKLTFTPVSNVLIHGSYRDSERNERGDVFGQAVAPTAGTIDEWRQRVGIIEGSWVINARSHATVKWTSYGLETGYRPTNVAAASASSVIGTQLNIQALHTQGRLSVPNPLANQPAYNAFIAPIIAQHGYIHPDTGLPTGGGVVGGALDFNDQDFFRKQGQAAYNITFDGGPMSHDLHVGYQRYTDEEDLVRFSNGWGAITVPGGRLAAIPGTGQSAFYTARYLREVTPGQEPRIVSSITSQSFEINDAIRMHNWTVNLGVLVSNDKLYGQGLRNDPSTLSGFVLSPGSRYLMYEVPFRQMIQPRLGATWAYNGSDTVYGSFARYNPAATSLPRAASWDRNIFSQFIDAHFDAQGRLFASVPVGSSSGKLFSDDLRPRRTDEFLVGTARQLNPSTSMRVYYRYRESTRFWEDVNNDARLFANAPPDIQAKGLYVPNLNDQRRQIGEGALSGSTYVIAELDDSFTNYHEVTLESEWRGPRSFVRGSYTWSRYYGNMDQDNSTTANDQAIFIGSSNIADGPGRQLWDFKEGRLRGDRPHMLKLYGYHQLQWNATLGAFLVAQSGQPWEAWSVEPYRSMTTSTSDVNRYAEPAGSRRSDAHWQMDMNYTQDIPLANRLRLQLVGDLYNVFNNQTGYNFNPFLTAALFGTPRSNFEPRRFQFSARLRF
jgi:hypothetical protein